MCRNIVVGTDCSPTSERAVGQAADLARRLGAVLHVVSAYLPTAGERMAAGRGPGVPRPAWAEQAMDDRHEQVRATVARLRTEGVDAHAHVGHGDPTAFLLESAGVLDADLIIVGDRGLKGLRRMAGSVPNSLAHRATIDVLVIQTT